MSAPLLPEAAFDDVLNIRIARLAAKLSVAFHREALKPAGISLQEWRVLVGLARYGQCHLRKISRLVQLDAAHASRVTQQLEKDGLIARTADPTDRRKVVLSLTETGQSVFFQIWPKAKDFSLRQQSALGIEDFETLKGILDNLMDYADDALDTEPV